MSESAAGAAQPPDRRDVLAKASAVAMAGGLIAGYGSAGAMAARYLYPARGRALRWLFVATVDRLSPGQSMTFTAPTGEEIAVARQGEGAGAEDFVALSSTCPHLGCQVHWQEGRERFFCPCHNGAFDAAGKATEGPPAEAGQSLPRFPLKVEAGLLYIEVPIERLSQA